MPGKAERRQIHSASFSLTSHYRVRRVMFPLLLPRGGAGCNVRVKTGRLKSWSYMVLPTRAWDECIDSTAHLHLPSTWAEMRLLWNQWYPAAAVASIKRCACLNSLIISVARGNLSGNRPWVWPRRWKTYLGYLWSLYVEKVFEDYLQCFLWS